MEESGVRRVMSRYLGVRRTNEIMRRASVVIGTSKVSIVVKSVIIGSAGSFIILVRNAII